MRVIIQKNYEILSQWVANYVVRSVHEHAPSSEKPFVLGLPTGSTPLGVYKALVEHYRAGRLSFKHVVTFNMDEYVGIPENHPQSYHTFMWDNFFSHIDIPRHQVHILNGNASDLHQECRNYEARIQAQGGIDLFLGGIGPDGHLAFNEPGSSLASQTRIKTLTQDTIIANSRFFENDPEKVPKLALTMGVGTIMAAREVVIMANGHNKARALQKVVEDGVNHMWTVSALQMHPKGMVVATMDACVELKVGTFNYFLDIESSNLDPAVLLN
jgi:glucosamine-6-phosphate deaminase